MGVCRLDRVGLSPRRAPVASGRTVTLVGFGCTAFCLFFAQLNSCIWICLVIFVWIPSFIIFLDFFLKKGLSGAAVETDGFTQKQHLHLDIARLKVLSFPLLVFEFVSCQRSLSFPLSLLLSLSLYTKEALFTIDVTLSTRSQ